MPGILSYVNSSDTSSFLKVVHRNGVDTAKVESHVNNIVFSTSTCASHLPSERMYCVPLCLKHDNFPCSVLVTVVLTDVLADDVTVEVAVVDAVVAVALVVTVDVPVVVIVV